MKDIKIAFIGGGNMGRAILSALLDNSLCKEKDIIISDKDNTRLNQLQQDFNIKTTRNNLEAIKDADIVILAIKPQSLDEVMAEMGSKLNKNQLVLSIIAGKSLDTLKGGLKHEVIVRAMPNTPAQIGKGMTVWTATAGVSEKQKVLVISILKALGEELYVAEEDYIDMATAVSGSGPAYVFLFMESLINAAVDIGLPSDKARRLVLQTVTGAAAYAHGADKSLAELRQMVTSPGGTTAEALKVLAEGDFSGLIKKAVAAAHRRAQELGSKK